jgi:hypothetical protein
MQAKELGYTCVPLYKIKNTHMKTIILFAISINTYMALTAQIITNSSGAAKLLPKNECDGFINAASMVSLGTTRATSTVFNHNGGVFDSKPLLTTTIETKEGGCVITTFSANSRPSDNAVVYQVRMDGVPLEGHVTAGMPGAGNITVPYVVEPSPIDSVGSRPLRMSSFTFFAQAKPGRHKIEVLLAACCSANMGTPPGSIQVDNATLVVQYNKN